MGLKKVIRKILMVPLIARPVRKFFWLCLTFTRLVNKVFEKIFHRLPYVAEANSAAERETLRRLLIRYYRHLEAQDKRYSYQPLISVFVPVYKPNHRHFEECLESVAVQTYTKWELCIVDDCSNDPAIVEIVKKFSDRFPGKVKFSQNPKNLHISGTSNACLAVATGEYAALLDHDDRLYPNALSEMVRHIILHDEPDILYSDERTVDEEGRAMHLPLYKPSWSPLLHLSVNYTTHLSVYRIELMRKIGGFRLGYEGSQDHDLMLRMVEASKKPVCHVPFCLYQWRSHAQSTAGNADAKPYAAEAGVKAVTDACNRRGRPAKVTFEPKTLHYRVSFEIKGEPLVSIIVPTKNGYDHISKCLEGVFGKSTYKNFEFILADNGSDEPRCLELFERYKKERGARFRWVLSPGPFNFAHLNNVAIQEAKGEYIVLLNNDTEVITPEWIEELLRLAQLPEAGAVGCKLLYPDLRIQHAGVVLFGKSIGRIAGHLGRGLKRDSDIYMNILNTVHEVGGITGACLMVSRKKYLEVGGLDEIFVPNGFGDVDFCLKLSSKGYTNIYTPYAELIHHESPYREANIESFEANYLLSKWGQEFISDKYFSIHFLPNETYGIDHSSAYDPPLAVFNYFFETPKEKWAP